jgi:hypothetical protein
MMFFIYVAGFIILLGLAKFMNAGGLNFKKRYLLKNGISAQATVINIEKTIFGLGEGFKAKPVMKIVLDIEISKNQNKQVIITHAFFKSAPPMIGDKINILIDPRDSDNIILP